MKSSKNRKKSKKRSGDGIAQQFLIWHGEKIVVGIVVVAALWLALMGLGYQAVPWQPDSLVRMAEEVRGGIDRSTRGAEDEDIKIFDYAEHAKQIRESIRDEPYRAFTPWHPPFGAFSPLQQVRQQPPQVPTTPPAPQ